MEDIGAVVFCQWCFAPLRGYAIDKSQQLRFRVYRKRWYLANVKLDMFISILYVNIANLKSVPIEIFAEILNVFMIVRNIRQNSDVFYIVIEGLK